MRTAQLISNEIKASTGNVIDPKFFDVVAQYAHFGMTFTVTTVFGLIGYNRHHLVGGAVLGMILCLSYAAFHEFYWDPTHENAATRGSDLKDFVFLLAGSCTAFVFLLVLL